jgi:hypothetical protein
MFGDAAVAQWFGKNSMLETEVVDDFAGSTPLLRWHCNTADAECTDVTGGTDGARKYEVEIARDLLFQEDKHTFMSTVPRMTPYEDTGTAGANEEIGEGLWYWRVRPWDASDTAVPGYGDIAGGWSDIDVFTKRTPAPVITSPNSVSGTNAVLTWAPVEGAQSYEVQWTEDESFQENITTKTTAQTSWLFGGSAGHTYFWRVRAMTDGDGGLWSDVDANGPMVTMTYRTKLSYNLSRSNVPAGQKTYVDGQLEMNGHGATGQTVWLQRKSTACGVAGSYANVSSQVTGSEGEEGTVRYQITTDRNRCYRLAWDAGSGDMNYSAPIPVTVRPIISLSWARKMFRRRANVKVTVRSNKAVTGRVRIQYRYRSSWRTIKTLGVTNMR